ncbi:MAG: 4Fe-4S dicluster domain-containing protein [Desulfobulbaceae bacterium]|nr:4Fe-4S dicluster domain-containing protein [Desulfobulbaceae bacterium]
MALGKLLRLWRLLRLGRRLCGAAVFILLTLLFVGTGDFLPAGAHFMARLQLVPALLAGFWLTLALLLLATVLFGRVYCSFICPLGILQDLLARLYSWRKKRQFCYRPPSRAIRLGVAVFFLGALLFGNSVLVTLLEPYSLYGIMAVHCCKQGWIFLNNGLSQYAPLASFFGLYPLPYPNLALASLLIATFLAVFFAVFVWLRGRDYCSRICPVGTVLGWLGRFALLRIRFDAVRCVHCRRCEQVCKTSCVDSGRQLIDYSRCVTCFNCLPVCEHQALAYRLPRLTGKVGNSTLIPVPKGQVKKKPSSPPFLDTKRRQFVGLHLAAVAGMGGLVLAQAKAGTAGSTVVTGEQETGQRAITPPGSRSRAHFSRRCTACQLCVASCPTRVLRPATGEYGFLHVLQPRMDFRHGYCNYDCVVCTQVCPSGAILPLTIQEKHETQAGTVQFVQHLCVVESKKQSCGACAEHCPSLAVKMVSYDKVPGLTIPVITPDLCVGCGACEHACPVVPDKAIYVQGLLVHQKARILPKGQELHQQVEGFGF